MGNLSFLVCEITIVSVRGGPIPHFCRYWPLLIPPILIPLDRAASQLKSHDGIGIGIELKASTFKGEIGIGIELKGFGPASELNQNRLLTELHITVVNQQ